jgi:protein-S-isoprenylcysteine O-methyltransferase Ste14
LRSLGFTLFVPGAVTVLFPWLLLRSGLAATVLPLGSLAFGGLLPLAAGIALYARCAWDFAVVGRGTPAPYDPPRRLVTTGPFAYVRNPIYLAVLLVIFGEAVLLRSATLLGYTLFLWVAFHLRIVHFEERRLRAEFGEAFERYRGQVPRWIPKLGKET